MSAINRDKRLRIVAGRDGRGAAIKNFSDLPDAILCNILSQLEMKEAIRTSVLSKRWEYLWASRSDLNFEERLSKRTDFMTIVDRAFAFRDSSSIRDFSLRCNVGSEGSRINTWIYAAVKRNVQRLTVELDGDIVLPYCLFTCPTLTSLSLKMPCGLSICTSVCLPALKNLFLDHVKFSHDNSIRKLLSGCPILEKLCFIECNWVDLLCLSISAPMLQTLMIYEFHRSNRGNLSDCQVAIFGTSNFKSFHYTGVLENDYCIYELSSVENAFITLHSWCENSKRFSYKAYKLLSGLTNAKKLILSNTMLQALSAAEELPPHFPMFQSLVHLQLEKGPVNLNCEALLMLLHCSHYLNTIEFTEGISLSTVCQKVKLQLNPVPLCFLTDLKSITIKHFSGSNKQLLAAKLLLKNALVLEKMTIVCSENTGGLQRKVTEQLREFPK